MPELVNKKYIAHYNWNFSNGMSKVAALCLIWQINVLSGVGTWNLK